MKGRSRPHFQFNLINKNFCNNNKSSGQKTMLTKNNKVKKGMNGEAISLTHPNFFQVPKKHRF